MKCIVHISTKLSPIRVKDHVASAMVNTGKYSYCAKSHWKLASGKWTQKQYNKEISK